MFDDAPETTSFLRFRLARVLFGWFILSMRHPAQAAKELSLLQEAIALYNAYQNFAEGVRSGEIDPLANVREAILAEQEDARRINASPEAADQVDVQEAEASVVASEPDKPSGPSINVPM